MASKLLNPRKIASLKLETGKKETLVLDGEGLYLRLRARSDGEIQKSWIFIYTTPFGQRQKLTLGFVKDHDLGAARKWAGEQRAMLDQHKNPAQVLKQATIEASLKQEKTLDALLKAYHSHLVKLGKTSARDAEGIFRLHVSAKLKAQSAKDITHVDLVKTIRKVSEAGKGRTAGKLRSYLHAAFESALGAQDDPRSSADLLGFGLEFNPVARIKTLAEFNRASERALSRAELREYVASIEKLPLGDTRDLLRLSLLLGGQRVSQLLRGQIGVSANDEQIVILKDKKGKRQQARTHILPLDGLAKGIVQARGNRLFDVESEDRLKQELERASGKVGDISKQMLANKKASSSFRLGDIRRTVETHMAGLGVSSDIRAQLQSHGLSGVQAKHYDRYDYLKEKTTVLKSWEAYLLEIPSANVVKIGKGGSSQPS